MNTLSWFIYLASVAGGVGAILFVGPWVVLAIISIYIGASRDAARQEIKDARYCDDGETARIAREALKNRLSFEYLKWAVPLALVVSLVGLLMPDKDTIYAIAASEIGEVAITSDTGQETLLDLKEIVDYQLEQLKGPQEWIGEE